MTNMAVSRRYVWQNKIIRLIFSFLIAIGAINHIAPFSVVYADELPYYESVNGSLADYYYKNGNFLQGFKTQNNGIAVRSYLFVDRSNWSGNSSAAIRFMYLSEESTTFYFVAAQNSWPSNPSVGKTLTTSNYSSEYNIYWFYERAGTPRTALPGCKAIVLENLTSMTQEELFEYVMENYESGSSIDYGDIKDLSYSTNIVGSGTTTGDANIDTISWYPYWDTNSNISTTWNMQLQVVPGTWQGGTATDIFSQSYQNFIINESGALDIYRGTYLNGSFSISWGEVKNKLSILSWADLFQYFDGTYWNKKGWVYRARFNDPDNDYWSDWQTVYTVTSSNGEGVENIIDPSNGTGLGDFNNNVENSYNTTSIVNNNYNVTYYYNGIPVDTNVNHEEITDYTEKIYEVTKQIRDILINLNTNNSTTENNDDDEIITNNLNSVVQNLHNTENEFMTDMDEKLTDIDNTFELLNNNKFIAAANWVRTQYDNIVLDTPFELLIVFGLILSLALVIIGKVK